MLSLTLNGNNIPLAADFTMQLTWKNPACFFDMIPGGFALGITIPINEFTSSLFGYPQKFTKYRPESVLNYPGFEVRMNGTLFMSGTLSITNSTGKNFEATLINHVGVMGEAQKEKDILDIFNFDYRLKFLISNAYNHSTHKFCAFPIVNTGFFTNKGMKVARTRTIPDPERTGQVKQENYEVEVMKYCFAKTTSSTVNVVNNGYPHFFPSTIDLLLTEQINNTYDAGQVSVVTPFLYLEYVLKQVLKANSFFLGFNFLSSDPSLQNLCFYNPYDITHMTFEASAVYNTISFEPIAVENGISNFESQPGIISWNDPDEINDFLTIPDYTYFLGKQITKYIRSYSDSEDLEGILETGVFYSPVNHLPKMKVGDLILSIQNLFNVCFLFLPNNTVNVYSRDALLTATPTDLNTFLTDNWSIGEKKHVSLKFTREKENKDLIFSERYTDLSDRRKDIKTPVIAWADLENLTPELGEIRFVKTTEVFAEYKWIIKEHTNEASKEPYLSDYLGWQEISIGYQDGWYAYGRDETEEIKSSFAPCYQIGEHAAFNQQGNMDAWKSNQETFSPRLLIQNTATTGGTLTPDFSFEYEKEVIGILPKYWKNWNPFWANRLPVSANFDFPINVLHYITNHICDKYRTEEGQFIIEEMSCEIFLDHIGTTLIKGYKTDVISEFEFEIPPVIEEPVYQTLLVFQTNSGHQTTFDPEILHTDGILAWNLGVQTPLILTSSFSYLYEDDSIKTVTLYGAENPIIYSINLFSDNIVGQIDLSDIMNNSTSFSIDLSYNPLLETVIFSANAILDINIINLDTCNIENINFSALQNATFPSNSTINLNDNNLTTLEVNRILCDIYLHIEPEPEGGLYNGRILDLGGNNNVADEFSGGFNGIEALAGLRIRKWEVITNTI